MQGRRVRTSLTFYCEFLSKTRNDFSEVAQPNEGSALKICLGKQRLFLLPMKGFKLKLAIHA